MAGYWEFPGGKVALGESLQQALARELTEELGVALYHCHPLMQLRHDYGDRVIELADRHLDIRAAITPDEWLQRIAIGRSASPGSRPSTPSPPRASGRCRSAAGS